jgi:subtilisin family serine protease
VVERISAVFLDGNGREQLFHDDELMLCFEERAGAPERLGVLSRLGARVLRRSRRGDHLSLRLPAGAPLGAALEQLLAESAVRFAEPRYLWAFEPSAACDPAGFDDPLLPQEWFVRNTGGQRCFKEGADIDLIPAWTITCGRDEVVIAILDSGMDLQHPDLKGRLYPQGEEDWNFSVEGSKVPADALGHGTSVAGLAAAAAGNGEGIAGVAPGARLMPLKVDGIDLVMNLVDALGYLTEFAGRHPELRLVANGSLNGGPDSDVLRGAVSEAYGAGIVLCFSSGNSGGAVEVPAIYPEAIAVGAIGPDGARKRSGGCDGAGWASNHGPELDLVAPGVGLATTDMTGTRGRVNGDYDANFGGTSGSCPIVAGVAALVLSANASLTAGQVREILIATATDGAGDPAEDTPGFDEFMGWGRVNAARAVRRAAAKSGDADCDGRVVLEDALRILRALFAGEPAPCPETLDVNGDGRVNITDPIHLLRWLFQGGPPPV